ncbi:MAG: glycosyltransferase family 9 protein [Bacteroidia bacterium]|nr:glycosyltransferase family 9 protein [Bacteroidia bacterium]
MAQVARILVIQPAYLGDAVLTLPLFGRLRDAYPDAELHWLVRAGVDSLFAEHPWVDRLWIWDKSWRGWWSLQKELRSYRWEGIIVVHRFLRMGVLGLLLPAHWRITYDKNPLSRLYTYRVPHRFHPNVHESTRVLSLLEPLGLPLALPPMPWIFFSTEVENGLSPWIGRRPYFVLSPTSRWRTKEAPFSLWKAFLRAVPSEYTIYVTGLPSEYHRLQELVGEHPNCYNLAGKLSLLQIAALLAQAQRLFTVDSALTHIASAVGCPTTTVYCSTVPAFGFGPLSPGSEVVETQEPLPCRPCGLHGKKSCPKGHFRCGYSLSESQLLGSLSAAPPPTPHTAVSPPPPEDIAPSL